MNSTMLKNRTKQFAHRCVRAAMNLPENKLGRHISSQLIRCSSSVAANYRAVCLAHSKAAFAAKLSIVIDESDESAFWLEFALEEKLFTGRQVSPLIKEATELCNIFMSSRKTVNNRNT
ncbi:MAG: four helix bundle protein [Chitinophagales bacterium]|nr:four helix bundle protein [Chitinophagales bacterium]